MRLIFVIQGEGRGHFTQALALKEILEENGHSIEAVAIGRSSTRKVPNYVTEAFSQIQIIEIKSPNFLIDKKGQGIKVKRSVLKTLLKFPVYLKAVRKLQHLILDTNPDIIINFYEPIVGLRNFVYHNESRIISIAHQYEYLHQDFIFPPMSKLQQLALKYFTKLTAFGSELMLGLSFANHQTHSKKLKITPPLLRKQIFSLSHTSAIKDSVLVYILNAGYSKQIIDLAHKFKTKKFQVFTDDPKVKSTLQYSDNLTFHALSGEKFLALMQDCDTLLSTAGFETIAEAYYLGKHITVVPVKSHYEQMANALEIKRKNIGDYSLNFKELNLDSPQVLNPQQWQEYRKWVESCQNIYIDIFIEIMKIQPEKA